MTPVFPSTEVTPAARRERAGRVVVRTLRSALAELLLLVQPALLR